MAALQATLANTAVFNDPRKSPEENARLKEEIEKKNETFIKVMVLRNIFFIFVKARNRSFL